ITDGLGGWVRRPGVRDGCVHLQSLHTTLGIAVNENEPLLDRDFENRLQRLAPTGAGYEHDDFSRRFDVPLGEPVNGHAHCRQLLLTAFATLLVEDGQLVVGRWQSVFAVELDGPRHRQLAVQLDGDFGRGRATVAAEEGPERAIAVGDFYFAKATRLIAEMGNAGVTSALAEALEAICASQIDDVALRGAFPGDRESYLRVVRGKTASLFAAACASGALLSGAEPEVVAALRRYGDLLGIAFQMADDMVDFSPSSGKPVGLDVRQRVLSLPLIYAAEDRVVGPEIRRLLAGSLGDAEVGRVTELV